MSKQQRIHIAIDDTSKATLQQYMEHNGCSQSQAGKAILEIGAKVWLRSLEDDNSSMGVMQILEKILQSCYQINAFQHLSANKEITKKATENGQPYEIKSIIQKANFLAKENTHSVLSLDKKRCKD